VEQSSGRRQASGNSIDGGDAPGALGEKIIHRSRGEDRG